METDKSQLSLTLLFEFLPVIDPQQLIKNIASIESVDTEIVVDVTIQLSNYLCASIEFEYHRLKLTGFPVPVPTHLRDMTIGFSDLSPSDKAALDAHKSYIICDYEGDDPSVVEQLISLYKAADGVRDRGLLGVLDVGAWSCKTPKMVQDMLSKKILRSARNSKPMYLATSLVKIPKSDGKIWFCTKGFHRFSSPEYAYLGTASEEEFIYDIFEGFFDLVNYVREIEFDGHQVVFGDDDGTVTTQLDIGKVYEYFDYLNSLSGVYVLKKVPIDPSLEESLQSNNLS
ncbi:hypothetical protein C7B77_08975 [Chamaesiphon polymorphus CCALA 037]|uniref:Uncharacterized protein n=2 Tax=Chamaesiphon TaxID=217161 RepID=A0A2T1GHU1_9CYAN|nr:hypothetical protein C7B77_08975 [Chamaesiphon polymorphus CCALA 037]